MRKMKSSPFVKFGKQQKKQPGEVNDKLRPNYISYHLLEQAWGLKEDLRDCYATAMLENHKSRISICMFNLLFNALYTLKCKISKINNYPGELESEKQRMPSQSLFQRCQYWASLFACYDVVDI